MKNKNTDRARFLLQRYASGDASPEERAELFTWIRKSGDHELTAYLKEMLESATPTEAYDQDRWDRMLKKIMGGDERGSIPFKTRRKFHVWTKIAAAVFVGLSLSFAVYWFLSRDTESSITEIADVSIRYKNDVSPGSNKATLTLADGREIILDNVQSGKFAQQGNTKIIKLDNGQLLYSDSLAKAIHPERDSIIFKSSQINTLTTPRGGQHQLNLPDGTKVWLNAASSISFPAAFRSKERRVDITGEAYFEVAKNPGKPFIVNINNKAEVSVLGTHFNINAYDNENFIKTTLLEGSVEVSLPGPLVSSSPRPSVILKPGQQAQLTKNNELKILEDDGEATAWKDGFFIFKSVDIKAIMRQVARWYDIEVIYADPPIADTFSGKISRSVNLSQLLKVLEKSEVHFAIEGRKIRVIQ